MKSRYSLVLFDLDGTLIDTLEDLAEAVNHALALRGLPLHSLEEYRKMVGHGVRNLVSKALPETTGAAREALVDSALADFKEWYTSHIDVHTKPYPGMQQLLRDLSAAGASIAVASNKFQAGTEKLIHEFFGEIPFVAILGNREGYPLKPDPEIVEEALRAAVRAREMSEAEEIRAHAVLVGDSGTDMQTARNGGIPAIAVGWGYRPMGPSEDYRFASSAEELRAMLID